MSHDFNSRKLAYCIAQPYATCGPPQLRGRMRREGDSGISTTIGILKDRDPETRLLETKPHIAGKNIFCPFWQHPIARELHEFGAPVIGSPSGTLGRNSYMLTPLVESGLLTQKELLQYVMGFTADVVYRGHHSLEEVALVFSQVLLPLKPWLDPIRTPQEFYEQLLTPEFLSSREYQAFLAEHQDFFDIEFSHRFNR